jgi:hypothetical protein
MCRELHDPLIFHDRISCKTKNAFQTIYFFQSLSTQFSTAFQEQRYNALKEAISCKFLRREAGSCARGISFEMQKKCV